MEPTFESWQAIPLRASALRQAAVAWLIVAVAAAVSLVVGMVIPAEALDQATSTGGTGMLAAVMPVVVTMFVVLGGTMFRHAVVAAPVVAGLAAVVASERQSPASVVWWIAVVLTVSWALLQAAASCRQLLAVRAVERSHRAKRRIEVDSSVVRVLRRTVLTSALWASGLTLAAVVASAVWLLVWGHVRWTEAPQGGSTPMIAVAVVGLLVGVLALSQWVRVVWSLISRTVVPPRVWLVPAGAGPVEFFLGHSSTGFVDHGTAARTPGCTCAEDEEDWISDLGVEASVYCPLHGVDVVNGLSPAQFSELAEEPWLWDLYSSDPVPLSSRAVGTPLVRFSGHGFTGLRARWVDRDRVSLGALSVADERHPGSSRSDMTEDGTTADWPSPHGVLDVIQLQTPSIQGFAVRYRHDRAQFVDSRGGATAEIPPEFRAHLR